MSKRLGNVVDPEAACNAHGCDIVRYWVASVDWQNDVPCSDNLLKQFGESYRNVRNTLRFLLGNLSGFDPQAPYAKITEPLDEWALEQTDLLVADCVDSYERYEFGAVITSVHNFCRDQLSKFYLDVIKDRMYCDASDSVARRSGQTACYGVLVRLVKLVAPILVYTAEETWGKLCEVTGAPVESVHVQTFGSPDEARLQEIEDSDLQERFAALIQIRDEINGAFEAFKATGEVKDSQDTIVTVTTTGEPLTLLRSLSSEELALLFKMSEVEVHEGASALGFKKSPYLKCQRSRLRRADVEPVEIDGQAVPLTKRDRQVLGI